METLIFISIVVIVALAYSGYKWFSKKPKTNKGGSSGGEEVKPQDPNYLAQG